MPLLGRTAERACFRYFHTNARIHQTAYVENRVPADGSNFSIARSSPRFPSCTSSSRRIVPRDCLRASITTSATLWRTSSFFARASPRCARTTSSRSASRESGLRPRAASR